MFKVEPYYTFDREEIDLPKSMFEMDRIIGKEHVLLPQQCDKDDQITVPALEKRQEMIFQELAKLENQINALETKFGVETTETRSTKTTMAGGSPAALTGGAIHDVVINANPASPPYSLVYLYKRLTEQYQCCTTVHVHSSVQSVSEKLLKCFGNGVNIDRPAAQIALTLIWKDVKHGPELRVNPSNQTPICGEANVARYLARLLRPGHEADVHSACVVDRWLDLASFSLLGGNAKERAAAVRSLNSRLGKKPWLLDNGVSFVDAVVYSALHRTGQSSGATGNVKTWLEGCEAEHSFGQMRTLIAC